jgi:uncharacterized DUF497 family protein
MNIDFDPDKNKLNILKHGLDLSIAADLDWNKAFTWVDDRFSYGEQRTCALLPSGDTVFFIAYTEREGYFRIISVRHANKKEVHRYVKEIS